MRYLVARSSCWSTSIFAIRALSPTINFSSSKTGFIALQGPHHSAKKSTKTGTGDCIKSSNFSIIFPFLELNDSH